MRRHRADLIALSCIFVALLVSFRDVLFGGRTWFIKDLFRYHWAMKKIVRDAIFSGEFPYWSPFYGSGQPLAANPAYELFYPPQWLVLLPDFPLGFTLHIVVHAFIAAAGMYALLRSFRAGAIAAAFGAVAFALGGPVLSLVQLLPFLFAWSWAPWIFLFARRTLLTGSRRDFLLAAAFGGLQALIAEPTTLMQTWGIVAAYAVYRAVRDRARFPRRLAAVPLMAIAALAVAAVQIIPTIDHARDSVRSRPISFDVVSSSSLAPSRPLEMLYPSFFHHTLGSNHAPRILSMYPNGEPFIQRLYLGAATLILFVAGLLARRRGWALVLALTGAAWILAIGPATPLLRILYDAGIFSSIRYPEKFVLAILVTAVIWAALTLQRLLEGDEAVLRWTLRVTAAWAAVAVLLLVLGNDPGAELGFWLRTLLRGGAVFAVVWAMKKRPSPVWGVALVVVLLLDVATLQSELNPTMPAAFFDEPAAAKTMGPNRADYRVFHSADWDWAASDPRAEAYFGSSLGPWWFIRNGLMPRTTPAWGFRMAIDQDYDETFLLPTADFVQSMQDLRASGKNGWEATFMAMANAGYYSRFRPYAEELKRTGGRAESMQPVEFVAGPGRNGAFYFADRIEQVGSREMFVEKMLAGSAGARTAFVDGTPFTPASGVVHRAAQTWRTATLDVEAAGRALLVISTTPHKYWHATIDGQEAPLQVANIGYQALEVPSGRHAISLVYSNPLVKVGGLISILALLVIAAGVVLLPKVPLPERAPERPRTVTPAQTPTKSKRKR